MIFLHQAYLISQVSINQDSGIFHLKCVYTSILSQTSEYIYPRYTLAYGITWSVSLFSFSSAIFLQSYDVGSSPGLSEEFIICVTCWTTTVLLVCSCIFLTDCQIKINCLILNVHSMEMLLSGKDEKTIKTY